MLKIRISPIIKNLVFKWEVKFVLSTFIGFITVIISEKDNRLHSQKL